MNSIARGANTIDYAENETIFIEATPADGHMYLVVEGEVDMIRGGQLLDTVRAGGIFGEVGLLDGLPRIATAVSRGCRVIAISENDLKEIVLRKPAITLEIMRVLSSRARHYLDLISK